MKSTKNMQRSKLKIETVYQSEISNPKRCMHDILEKKEPLYFEIDTFRIGPGAGLQYVWDGLNCPKETAPENTLLRPTAFARKSYMVLRHT